MLGDPRVSADITRPGYPSLAPITGGSISFILMDDPEHARLRRMVTAPLTRPEAAQMGVLMLIAGHETTANMIALGTLALLENPGQLALLRDSDDPAVVAGWRSRTSRSPAR